MIFGELKVVVSSCIDDPYDNSALENPSILPPFNLT